MTTPSKGHSGKDDGDSDGELQGDRLGQDQGAEDDGDDGQQVGHGRGQDGAVVGDDPVVDDVGDAGADDAKHDKGGDGVGSPGWVGQSDEWGRQDEQTGGRDELVGKSALNWSIIYQLAPAIADGTVQLWESTPKPWNRPPANRCLLAWLPALAKAPRVEPEEVEPYSLEEVQRILAVARSVDNGARWAIALALGLRQGEVLGLKA